MTAGDKLTWSRERLWLRLVGADKHFYMYTLLYVYTLMLNGAMNDRRHLKPKCLKFKPILRLRLVCGLGAQLTKIFVYKFSIYARSHLCKHKYLLHFILYILHSYIACSDSYFCIKIKFLVI